MNKKYWYVASPYSKYPEGIEQAWINVCKITGKLISAGVPVYSPIAHTHPIAIYAEIDPYSHDIWLPADEPMMANAYGLIVVMMDGWMVSYGIGVEVDYFVEHCMPVVYISENTSDFSKLKDM